MITSVHNPKIQSVRALLARRQERSQRGEFIVEGVRLVEEAVKAGWKPRQVFFSRQLSVRGLKLIAVLEEKGTETEEVAANLMDSLADTETTQGIMAVFSQEELPLPEKLDFVIILDQLRDPGNLGTILRSAAAGGVQAVILTPGSVDAFSPKVLRAGMGAHFQLPVRIFDWSQINDLAHRQNPRLRLLLAEAEQGKAHWTVDLRSPIGLVIGGEAEGASAEALALVESNIMISMPGKSESLNAAVAASILIFEVVRQRSV